MTRVSHTPYDLLTAFDLRTHIFRVDEYLVTYFHEHHQKVTFGGFLFERFFGGDHDNK